MDVVPELNRNGTYRNTTRLGTLQIKGHPGSSGIARRFRQNSRYNHDGCPKQDLNRLFTEYHHYERPPQMIREVHKAIFPNNRAIRDALWSIAHGKRPRRQPLTLRKGGKLPFSSGGSNSLHRNRPRRGSTRRHSQH